ncbi:MAG TPA: AAA family ATPase, partial [Rhodanobacteraceae bacterium]|nr:AAA family ATPase [Rhodanobacteraceae bacterium]
MKIESLRASSLRCFEALEFVPGPRISWLIGPNGAGKTTILEAAHILSHGRSFRPGGRVAPTRRGAHEYLIYAEVAHAGGRRHRLGLVRTEDHWEARLDGKTLSSLGPLFAACPVVFFGPESQTLVSGSAEERRNYLDWSVFHVEHGSLDVWRMW